MASSREAISSFSTVIVTGGSSGIGKSFIKLLGKLNPSLSFCNLSRRKPDIKVPGLRLHHISCDLAQPAAIAQGVGELEAWLASAAPTGRVLLINNSGFGAYGHFPDPNLPHQLEMIDVNIRAVLDLTGRLLPVLKTRGGTIISVASTAAFQPTAYMAAYGASKTFVLHWSLALNEELRGTGVNALAVCPGPTSTDFFRRAGLQEGSVADALGMTCEEVVMAALRALAAGRSVVVTGYKNKIGAFLVSKLPKPLAAWLAAKVLARFRLNKVAP
ncbi:MAG: SDR family NAD(P)-dependent oxidoreductase [Opitutaceae bacterium]|nr:SDR family NAD(P)-dependent oxidoreductase [Opitutaceae bacterium]MBP9912095.1 SDR family NAD(P)-dependent oxidoreductase [Opitutaceae bacterium]